MVFRRDLAVRAGLKPNPEPAPSIRIVAPLSPSLPPSRGAGWVWAQSFLMLALVLAGPLLPGAWHAPLGVAFGGMLFLIAGVVGVTGVLHLEGNRTPFPRPLPNSRLIVQGIYGWVRHPLYLSVMLAGFAWALLWQSGAVLGLAMLQVGFFEAKARREELWLRQVFPGYPDYASRVRRFIPGLY